MGEWFGGIPFSHLIFIYKMIDTTGLFQCKLCRRYLRLKFLSKDKKYCVFCKGEIR